MHDSASDKFWDEIVFDEKLKKALVKRKKPYSYESVSKKLVSDKITEGWEVDKEFKHKVRLKKIKPNDVAFEDEVWTTFAGLGFKYLNKGRHLAIPYSDEPSLTQQIDVFAADEETILFVECKAAKGEPKIGNFKETLEALKGKKDGLIKGVKKQFPNSKHKFKFIFTTKNYGLSKPDQIRLEDFKIDHFDEATIRYYKDLTKQLGVAARYQLLGNLYAGMSIPELDIKIPAIQGKLGGHTYYSFSIEPEKLLKIGYVLHRTKAIKKLMPTYQRIIKKARLTSIQNFIKEGGFFPNAVIINIDSGKKLQFDKAKTQLSDSIASIGILHLPKLYRSAFIIDGQHRLYGYAKSDYKSKNSIPVVAFVNLKREEQVRLFMQINENQKAVPKNLRNTLNADLLWDSDNLLEQIIALKLQIAQDLGETINSPLYGMIIIGENPKTLTRCITIDTIKVGLDRSNFFGSFSNNSIIKDGTFYKGNNDDTMNQLIPFITDCFTYIKEQLPDEWSKGEADDGYISINAGIESLIRIFSDIIDHLIKCSTINPKSDKIDSIVDETKYYLDPLVQFFKDLSSEAKQELRQKYGVSGRTKYWRTLQNAIYQMRGNFEPEGMLQYWQDQGKNFNIKSIEMIRAIETFFKDDFRNRLKDYYGDNWFKKGVPGKIQDATAILASRKNRKIDNPKDEKKPWDCILIIDYREIAIFGSNWRDIFEKYYTKPGEEKLRGGKDYKTKWMQKLEYIRNQNFHDYSVKESEYQFLIEVNDWLIERK